MTIRIKKSAVCRFSILLGFLSAVAFATDYGDRITELLSQGLGWTTVHGENGITYIGSTDDAGLTYATAEIYDADGELVDFTGGLGVSFNHLMGMFNNHRRGCG
ncbi:MAG: hypothetical protein AAFQ99_10215, partial [Pseudomonadota bacterium]